MSISEYFRQFELLLEAKNLGNPGHCPRGMYLTPSPDNIYQWHGVYFPPSGPYFTGVFRLVIDLPPTYPQDPPRVFFATEMWHPLVNGTTRELDLRSPASPISVWDPARHRALDVLWAVKYVFADPFFKSIREIPDPTLAPVPPVGSASPEPARGGVGGGDALSVPPITTPDMCVNREAWKMCHHEPKLFQKYVDTFVENSLAEETLYAAVPPENPIRFCSLPETELEKVKQKMLKTRPNPYALSLEEPIKQLEQAKRASRISDGTLELPTEHV
ncbi:hypothetical protein GGF32_006172 [Allomyces javanicus]|nr:hypothetical protein GGF32_006172 [Allomyces javanicus]